MKKKNFAFLVPARAGSKSIKNKNILKLGNKRLIEYTFDAIPKKYYKNTFVISDDKKVKKISKKYSINTDYVRPKNLSKDDTSLFETIYGFHKWIKLKKKYDFYIILQPTSPLRSKRDILASIEIFKNNSVKSHFSVSESIEHPYETIFFKKKKIKLLFPNAKKYFRRQDFDKETYFINGAIYISHVSLIEKQKKIYSFKSLSCNVMSKKNSVDLNDNDELSILRKILNRN